MSETKKTSAEQAKGSVKEAIGKLTGDSKVELEGRQEKKGSAKSSTPAPDERPQK